VRLDGKYLICEIGNSDDYSRVMHTGKLIGALACDATKSAGLVRQRCVHDSRVLTKLGKRPTVPKSSEICASGLRGFCRPVEWGRIGGLGMVGDVRPGLIFGW
jgi:hypothetical protein